MNKLIQEIENSIRLLEISKKVLEENHIDGDYAEGCAKGGINAYNSSLTELRHLLRLAKMKEELEHAKVRTA